MEEEKGQEIQNKQSEASVSGSFEKTQVGFPGQRPVKERPKVGPIIVIILFLIIIGASFWFLLGSKRVNRSSSKTPTPTTYARSSSPTPTPTEKVIPREGVKIQILNGTDISGAAARLRGEFESLGYSGIEIGNARQKGYTGTQVTFAKEVDESVKEEILEKLKEIYQSVETKEDSLKDFDIQVITGYPKGYSPTPTPKTLTPTPTATPTPAPTTTTSPTPTPQ